MAVIKAGTYRFNDVLTQGYFYNDINGYNEVYFDYQVEVVANGQAVTLYCNTIYQEPNNDGGSLQYICVSSSPDLSALGIVYPFGQYVYHGATSSWTTEYGEGIKTIIIPEDTEVSAEFYEWFAINAIRCSTITYNGSIITNLSSGQTATLKCKGMKMESDVVVEAGARVTKVIDKSTAFFEDSFPSDTWNDGTYTGTVFGAPVTMRYRYRVGKEDPQNIPFVAMIQADNSDFEQTENLADFYLKTAALYCGRIEATTTGDCLTEILYDNPVVPTFYDMSQLYSADIGMPCHVTLNATHCGIRNYDGLSYADIGCMDTVVTYAVETDLRPEEIGYCSVAHALHMVPLRLAWYHESYFAFGGLEYKDYPKPFESVTENGDYYWWPSDGYSGVNHVRVNVQPRLQEKIMVGKGEVVADEGYYGLSKVTVTTDGGLLYQISEPTYFDGNMLPIDTGVRLFDTARDFTILMDITSEGNGCLIHCQNPNNDGIIVMQSTYDTRPEQWMVSYNGLVTFIDCSPLSANRYRFVIVGNTLPEYSVFVGNVTEGNAEVDCSDRANSHHAVEPFTETAYFGGVKISEGAYTNLWKGTFHDLKILGRAVGQIERQMYLETGEIVM